MAWLQTVGITPVLSQPVLWGPWPCPNNHPDVCLARVYFATTLLPYELIPLYTSDHNANDRRMYVVHMTSISHIQRLTSALDSYLHREDLCLV